MQSLLVGITHELPQNPLGSALSKNVPIYYLTKATAFNQLRYTDSMNSSDFNILLADLILITHALFVVFVVVGLILILIGGACSWFWVRNPWFRLSHLIAIGFVVIQSWFGATCPLTIWESSLREKAGEVGYQETFVSYWLEKLLYYQFPQWVFVVVYSLFGALVLISWFCVRPRSFRSIPFNKS